MADAAMRARLEAAQVRAAELRRELERELPHSPVHDQTVSETRELQATVSTLEAKLALADEANERRAGGFGVVDLVVSAGLTALAALPGLLIAGLLDPANGSVSALLGSAGGALLLSVPLAVNGLRLRRGRLRAARSRTLRAWLARGDRL